MIYIYFYFFIDKIHKDNPLVGDKVKVFSQLKGGFFRAKILRKNNCGSFDILYIDYGSKETIPSNEIYQLADKLLKVFNLFYL